ncbi:MAG: hypothetical protein A4E53_02873 [Pelotomaculum sp. PtaB.Bin104]|nr:MAG: hypothetical protein A4E53_02873 [Pelotomaculum sp. PtaB.Bin104]
MFTGKKTKLWPKTILVLTLFMALIFITPAQAIGENAGGVSLTLSPPIAPAGASVTASGTSAPGVWLSLKVLDSLQNIVLFDAFKSDDHGNYSITFVVPAVANGNLSVVAGYGNDVAVKTLTVDSQTPVRLKGDVNYDSIVNVLDVVKTVNIALGKVQPSPDDFYAADVNSDSVVNVLDVVKIVNIALNLQ